MHAIHADATSGIVTIKIAGLCTLPEVMTLANELTQHARSLRLAGKIPALLYDYSDAVIQPQDVVAALADMAAAAPARARKVAIFTEGRLARRQARRVADAGNNIRTFEDRADALQWLQEFD